jgi:hypothetical protein
MPVGVDLADMPIYAELARQGIDARDGQQVMLDARQIKDRDKITMLSMAAAVVDGTYQDIVEALKPGVRENEIAALANKRLYEMGSDDVESINAVSGEGCNPHPHNFSDRMIRPGYQAVFDIMHSYNGYRTCHYRTVNPVARRPRSATRSSRLAAGSMPRSRRSSSACPPGRPAVAHRAGDRHGGREDRPRPAVRSWDLRGTNVRSSAGSSSLESPDGIHESMVFALEAAARPLTGVGGPHRGRGRRHRFRRRGADEVSCRRTVHHQPVLIRTSGGIPGHR